MRVLWFTNVPMPIMIGISSKEFAGTGGWMFSLLDALKRETREIEIGVACIYPGLKTKTFKHEGITYFSVSQGGAKRFFHFKIADLQKTFIQKCLDIVEIYKPDIIHIHGTERPYGLLTTQKTLNIPIVISIQGLLSQCSKWIYTFSDLDFISILKMHKFIRIIRGIGPFFGYIQSKKRARIEEKILRNCKFVFGRTEWDKAHVMALNPKIVYYNVGEVLRPEFYNEEWNIKKIRRYSIFFTNSRGPRRNIHVLYKAISILEKKFSDIQLFLAGNPHNEYTSFLQHLARKLKIEKRIKYLGILNAKELAKNLTRSHVFVIPSLIENSPNSLCEAQLVGVPCIASYTGGICSLVEDKKTGLFFPPNDSVVLAYQIAKVFNSDDLAIKLGREARNIARIRHDPYTIVKNLLNAYEDIISRYKN